MFNMLAQLWSMLAIAFGAGQKGANALDNVMTLAEEASQNLLIESRMERKAKLNKLQTKLGISAEDMAAMSQIRKPEEEDA